MRLSEKLCQVCQEIEISLAFFFFFLRKWESREVLTSVKCVKFTVNLKEKGFIYEK